jgi:adenylylsulfate kinase-like enzyme
LTRNDVVAIAAAISPYKAIRNENRALIGRFVEVYVECPIEVLTARDVKGLYQKALNGEIKNFTGVSDPYEPPDHPEVLVNTAAETIEESTARIIRTLELMGYIPPAGADDVATPEEEEKIKDRLRALGYIE